VPASPRARVLIGLAAVAVLAGGIGALWVVPSTVEPTRVGWRTHWVEQVGDRTRDCHIALESDPPECGGGLDLPGFDLRDVPEAEREAPDRWSLHEAYLVLDVSADGSFRRRPRDRP
jgi:hypothetical protein